MTTNANLPAMPNSVLNRGGTALLIENIGGLTKREMFAMEAMHGIFANDSANLINPEMQEIASRLAVLCADALLAELEK